MTKRVRGVARASQESKDGGAERNHCCSRMWKKKFILPRSRTRFYANKKKFTKPLLFKDVEEEVCLAEVKD
jgi:hypothetical protein